MTTDNNRSNSELVTRVAKLLNGLGPFTSETPREDKWRTTEQITYELMMFNQADIDHVDQVLRQHEKRCLERLENGLEPDGLIRRAKYPDRTTALPLWGSTKLHGQPWAGQRPDRSDRPDDISPNLSVPDTAPHVFLSHTYQDANLALRLAERLATMKVGSWRFETHVEQRGDIAKCVREAISEAACVLAFVTRWSIASLWVLTELHSALHAGVPIELVLNTDDFLLTELFQTARFPHPNEDFDLSVEYNRSVIEQLKEEYGLRESPSRTARYDNQARDFLATLPSYLGNVSPETAQRVWRPAFAFPRVPSVWSGTIDLVDLRELPDTLARDRS